MVFKLSLAASNNHGPASFHVCGRQPARTLALIQLLLLLLQSLKCTTPQLPPSTGGYLQWLQLQKKKKEVQKEEAHHQLALRCTATENVGKRAGI